LNFATLRLGKDSKSDIQTIAALTPKGQHQPYKFETSCTQLPKDITQGTILFVWLGSDNPKGIATDWSQGFRAIGEVTKVTNNGHKATSTLEISLGYIFEDSVGRKDFLREAPESYYWCSDAPIIGVDDRANQTVRIIDNKTTSSVRALLNCLTACGVVEEAALTRAYPQLEQYLTYEQIDPRTHSILTAVREQRKNLNYEHNLIYFGAPGTGKSHRLNTIAKTEFSGQDKYSNPRTSRVTFHPRYSYFQFVGSYKPHSDEEGNIQYSFSPGPFTNSLVNALNNESENYLLVMEELNRADTAAVFGDVFQLLDRDASGTSAYPITLSEELSRYLANNLSSEGKEYLYALGTPRTKAGNVSQIVLPPNLYLWATMNSADQGVFPLDSAFKRRWSFAFVDINENSDLCEWNYERTSLNRALKVATNANEDKLIGPFFLDHRIQARDPDGNITNEFLKAFENKVLLYIVEDAARYAMKELTNPEFVVDGATFTDYVAAWRQHNFGIFTGLSSWPQNTNPASTTE